MEAESLLDLLKSYQDRSVGEVSPTGQSTGEVVNLSGGEFFPSEEVISCKFVILGKGEHYLLIFGDIQDYPYHAKLLEGYCKREGIARHWVRQPDQLHIEDPQFQVLGGGYLELDGIRRKVRVSGSSKAYGYYDSDAVRLITSSAPEFASFAVAIEM